MSNKASRIANTTPKEEPTVNKTVRISLNLHWYNPEADLPKDSFVTVQKIPESQKDQEALIRHTAEQTLINCINSRLFLELYEPGKSAKDSEPEFYNLTKVDVVQIKEVIILE